MLVSSSLAVNLENQSESGFEQETRIIDSICRNCRIGSMSLLSNEDTFHTNNTDLTIPKQDHSPDSNGNTSLKSFDILYLNMFRIFNFILKTSDNESSSKYIAHRLLYFPNISFKLSSISQPFKLVSTPLAQMITRKIKPESLGSKSHVRSDIKFGFISLDKSQRMLPLMTSDPFAAQIPLIGLWVHGLSRPVELLSEGDYERGVLMSILFEYINNSSLNNRYSFNKDKKTFLIALFSPEEGSRFYEVEYVSLHI